MNKSVILDPWIEGYLDYQRTVRRLAANSIKDLRCTLKRVGHCCGRPSNSGGWR